MPNQTICWGKNCDIIVRGFTGLFCNSCREKVAERKAKQEMGTKEERDKKEDK